MRPRGRSAKLISKDYRGMRDSSRCCNPAAPRRSETHEMRRHTCSPGEETGRDGAQALAPAAIPVAVDRGCGLRRGTRSKRQRQRAGDARDEDGTVSTHAVSSWAGACHLCSHACRDPWLEGGPPNPTSIRRLEPVDNCGSRRGSATRCSRVLERSALTRWRWRAFRQLSVPATPARPVQARRSRPAPP